MSPDADVLAEIEILRGRAAENSSLQAHIVELGQNRQRERALADDLAACLDTNVQASIDPDRTKAVLARYREARR